MMDFGSAAFVFTSGLMQKPHQPRTKFTKLITSSWPLALLASARLVAVKLTGYPEHVTEYGVHWNFFATLSCLRVASHFTGLAINAARAHGVPAWCTSFGLAAAIIAAWQCMLMNGMHEYILTAPRGEGVFSENRCAIIAPSTARCTVDALTACAILMCSCSKLQRGYLRRRWLPSRFSDSTRHWNAHILDGTNY